MHGGVYYGLQIGVSFKMPYGVAVDGKGNVFVADYGNNLVRKIDAKTGAVTSLGTSAFLPFSEPTGVAVDGDGNVFVADYDNNLVRRIDAKTGAVTRLGRLYDARVFSWDLSNPNPKSYAGTRLRRTR